MTTGGKIAIITIWENRNTFKNRRQTNITIILKTSIRRGLEQGFILHRIGDDYIIMQDGSSNVDFSKVISLNQTSAMLWQEIENKEFDTDSVTEALTSRYDVDNESARRDAQKFIDSLDREGIIE